MATAWVTEAGRGLPGAPEDMTLATAMVSANMLLNGSVMLLLSAHCTESTSIHGGNRGGITTRKSES